jgi:flagella basal body P-ring formation protein FlgA
MTSFDRKLLLLGLAPLLLGMKPGSARSETMPIDAVAEQIAARWCVTREAICLEWGQGAEKLTLPPETSFDVVGKGLDGWFAVLCDRPVEGSVTVRVRAGFQDTVMVAARPLTAGNRIAAGDLRSQTILHWGPPEAGRFEAPVPGWEVRRHVAVGEIVRWPSAIPPAIVVAGQPVRLEWARGGVLISVTGVAINSARKGEVVKVRISGRSGRLCGIAMEPGKAVLAAGGIQ